MVQLVSPKRFSSNYSPNMDFSESHKPSTVCKQALLRKVKTNKHKYFVLHKESAAAPARLEYYHSESHWHKKKKAKRTIYLKACFSINAFTDTKVKYGINIFTNDDSFQIGFESEQMRDMWLADVRLLSHTSAHQIHNIVKDQTWHVQVQAGSVALPIKGDFELRVSEKLVSLESKDAAKNMYILPLDVIINCLQHGRCCGIEVNENAVTGAGQIWLTLEDELIAHDVCRVLVQNKSLSSPGVDTFRPVSRSLSYKDRHSAFRVRTGSDVRQRSRTGQSFSKLSPGSTCYVRDRSDSIGSHSTSASQSTDESDSCLNWGSRSTTPDPRSEFQSHHVALLMKAGENSFKSSQSDHSYAEMTGRSQDKNSNFMYVDMSGSHNLPYIDKQQNRIHDYIDMTAGRGLSPNSKVSTLRPDSVKCYLVDDEDLNNQPKPTNFPNPKISPSPKSTDEYVEMCRKKMLADKSSSAPHLLPMLPCQQSIEQKSNNDIFMNMEFDIRNRAASISCPHRPRGSSWSQYIRPRSSTTDHKRRAQRKYKASNNSADSLTKTSEYVDMTCGSALSKSDSHTRMSLDKNSKQKPAPVNGSEREDKENFLPNQLAVRVPPVSHPFPELLFTSSEDDVSLHSMDGSTSLHSLTGSADSMSTSSHSSHHSSFAPTTSLDAEAYVAMQPPPSSAYVRSASHRLLLKPAKVTSYILDDTEKSTGHADYMEMSANSYSRTKQ